MVGVVVASAAKYLLLCACCLSLISAANGNDFDSEERILAELELSDLELEDQCDRLSDGLRSSIKKGNSKEKEIAQNNYAQALKYQRDRLHSFENVPYEALRNWTVMVTPGDALLDAEDFASLTNFQVSTKDIVAHMNVPCNNFTGLRCNFSLADYEATLVKSTSRQVLEETWSSWQATISHNIREDKFENILGLATKAAILNGKEDVESYWEMLSDHENAYEKAGALWQEIKPLYFRLHEFVKARIFHFYNVTGKEESELPVYLLGSNFGNDWSHIADKVLPHPQFYFDYTTQLNKMSKMDIYRAAENLSMEIGLGPWGETFWNNSKFNANHCDADLLNFCSQKYSELVTCNKTSWVEFLDVFEMGMDISLRNDYSHLPRLDLRYSAIDEALKALGPSFAITELPSLLGIEHVLENVDSNADMTKLLLVALRVLPKLPFYLAADQWRLHELRERSDNVSLSWWKLRQELQGVQGVTHYEPDFLQDSYISSNKPYLSKFLGQVFQFQIIDYYRNAMPESNVNIAYQLRQDENFIKMIKDRSANDWPYLMNFYYGIYEISAAPLLEYFRPLEEYFVNAPLQQQKTVKRKSRPKVAKPRTMRKLVDLERNGTKTVEDSRLSGTNATSKTDKEKESPLSEGSFVKSHRFLIIALSGLGVAVIAIVVVRWCSMKKRHPNNRRFDK